MSYLKTTNKDYYADEIIKLIAFGVHKESGEPFLCDKGSCRNCLFYKDFDTCCYIERKNWLNKKYSKIDWENIPVDTLVYIEGADLIRHFKRYEPETDTVVIFSGGRDSHTTVSKSDEIDVSSDLVSLYKEERKNG